MNKIILGIVVVIVLGGGTWYFVSQTKPSYTEQMDTTEQITTETQKITMTDVAKHNSEASCYTFISGSVYDITSYIPKHPGGKEAVLKVCGTDGTSLFTGKHGKNEKAKQMLETMKIGSIAQ